MRRLNFSDQHQVDKNQKCFKFSHWNVTYYARWCMSNGMIQSCPTVIPLGDILYPVFWLVENRSTVRCICFRWTLYQNINFQPIRTCLRHTQFRVSFWWTCITLQHSVCWTTCKQTNKKSPWNRPVKGLIFVRFFHGGTIHLRASCPILPLNLPLYNIIWETENFSRCQNKQNLKLPQNILLKDYKTTYILLFLCFKKNHLKWVGETNMIRSENTQDRMKTIMKLYLHMFTSISVFIQLLFLTHFNLTVFICQKYFISPSQKRLISENANILKTLIGNWIHI